MLSRQARADKQSQLRSNRLMTKSSLYIRLRSLNKNGLLMAQFSRYQFIPSAKLFTQYISRPFFFKIYGCDLVLNLLDIIGYLSGLCLSARACRVYRRYRVTKGCPPVTSPSSTGISPSMHRPLSTLYSRRCELLWGPRIYGRLLLARQHPRPNHIAGPNPINQFTSCPLHPYYLNLCTWDTIFPVVLRGPLARHPPVRS